MNPNICVVVPARNRIELSKRFLKAFKKSTYKAYTIVLVDDGSTDGTSEYLAKKHPDVVVIKGDGNLWWTGATNKGVEYAIANNYDYVLTINQDSVVDSKFLEIIVNTAKHHPNSLIGSTILREDNGNIWSVGGTLNWNSRYLFNLNFYNQDISILKTLPKPFPAEVLNGNGTLIPVEVFKTIGKYNFTFTPHYHADSEICLRAAKYGYKSLVCLDAHLINNIPSEPLINSRWKLVFWRKSDYYWRPLLFFYLFYSPKRYIHGLFKQYFHFFQDLPPFRWVLKLKKLIPESRESLKDSFMKILPYLDIIKRRLLPRKRIHVNKHSRKIVYIGHSYHSKTLSTVFLIEYLKEHFDVTEILDESWQGKPFPDLSFIDDSYVGVVFFQSIPEISEVEKINNKNIIFIPMYDGYENAPYSFWKQYENLKILNFSKTLYKKIKKWGFNTIHLQRYPKPFEFKDWGKKDSVFFYNRNSLININTVKKLIGKNKFNIHLHKTLDPGYEFVAPTKEDEKKYSITYSEWFVEKKDKWAVAEKSAIFVAPRITEGIGQGEIEAMALGRAVIAVNAPTLNEYIVHNVNGYLYDFNNPQPIDFSNLREVQKNAYQSIIDGYNRWEKKKIEIINFIKSN